MDVVLLLEILPARLKTLQEKDQNVSLGRILNGNRFTPKNREKCIFCSAVPCAAHLFRYTQRVRSTIYEVKYSVAVNFHMMLLC